MDRIIAGLDGHWLEFIDFALAVCAVVVLVRFGWVMSYSALVQLKNRWFGAATPRGTGAPNFRTSTIVSWCGMRGIITLATALALPERTAQGPFPHRDVLVFAAFAVVLFTLIVQGLSLPLLLSRMRLGTDDSVGAEMRHARAETARAALLTLDGNGPEHAVLRREYEARLHRAEMGSADDEQPSLARAVRRAVDAEREALLALRSREEIGDAAFRRLEEDLDLAEIDAQARLEEG